MPDVKPTSGPIIESYSSEETIGNTEVQLVLLSNTKIRRVNEIADRFNTEY